MNILGINAYHGDSSACLLRNGVLVAAAEEERFRRIKHWAGFPSEAIRYCLREAGLSLSAIDHVAINRDPSANFAKKILHAVRTRPDIGLLMDRIKNAREWSSLEVEFHKAFPDDTFDFKIHQIEHHAAHLSSAFHVSPFDRATVVSVDGFGDFSSTAWGEGNGSNVAIDGRVFFPHSLGIFYMAMTQYLGFPYWGDEYKVMGLAPYGSPTFMDEMKEIVQLNSDGSFSLNLKFFRHHQDKLEEWHGGIPHVNQIYTDTLEDLLGKARNKSDKVTQRHKDLARSMQAMYEEAFFHLLNTLHERQRLDNLALAGGCAMNSVANGKIYRNTPFKKVYIQSAAGDAGGAIGSAYAVWHRLGGQRNFMMSHSYWGPSYDNDSIRVVLGEKKEELVAQDCDIENLSSEDELCVRTARAISEGKVIGWFQGRMEWGPRALGNRSILGDPRRSDMKDILNLKIKRRESFRPFAPSILRESVADWFEEDGDVPFMMQVFQIRESRRPLIPAVTHVDGSGRLQTVCKESNARYYKLISAFSEITGVPIVLNTSFNENEPVVCQPIEALDCFLRTKMDVLVLGDFFIERRSR